jgi:hypothetical protein
MPLETAIICLDTSAWMRNGDYPPTRLGAQYDRCVRRRRAGARAAVTWLPSTPPEPRRSPPHAPPPPRRSATTLCEVKIGQNPESTVGLLAYGGGGARLLSAPTEDTAKLFAALTDLRAEGGAAMPVAIKTAMLALKHRKNKNGAQRVVVFVGSPVALAPEVRDGAGRSNGGCCLLLAERQPRPIAPRAHPFCSQALTDLGKALRRNNVRASLLLPLLGPPDAALQRALRSAL